MEVSGSQRPPSVRGSSTPGKFDEAMGVSPLAIRGASSKAVRKGRTRPGVRQCSARSTRFTGGLLGGDNGEDRNLLTITYETKPSVSLSTSNLRSYFDASAIENCREPDRWSDTRPP